MNRNTLSPDRFVASIPLPLRLLGGLGLLGLCAWLPAMIALFR